MQPWRNTDKNLTLDRPTGFAVGDFSNATCPHKLARQGLLLVNTHRGNRSIRMDVGVGAKATPATGRCLLQDG